MTHARASSAGHHLGAFFQPADRAPDETVAHLAWAWWAGRADDGAVPLSEIVDALARISTPAADPQAAWRAHILAGWRRALAPSEAAPGTPAHAVARLVEARRPAQHDDRDPRVAAVEELGFAAAPALIDALSDDRPTRWLLLALNNFAPRPRTAAEVASDLLIGLAGDELGGDWLSRRQGAPIARAAAEAWWRTAAPVGEQTWFTDHALPAGAQWPAAAMVRRLGTRYPSALAAVYRRLLDERPEMHSWQIADTLAASALPRADKIALLSSAATHDRLEHRRAALWRLSELAPPAFERWLVATLRELPNTPEGPYWSCTEASFAQLTLQAAGDAPWAALRAFAIRADVGLRVEILKNLSQVSAPTPSAATRRLNLWRAFLDDAAVRDVTDDPRRFTGPHAAMSFPRIAVRDLAAWLITTHRGHGAAPEPDWTDAQWKALRHRAQRPEQAPR